MSETQFYISVAVLPVTTIIIVLIGVLLNNANMNARFGDMNASFNARFADIDRRFVDMNASFNTRFADLKDLIQANSDRQDANLRRVEVELEVLELVNHSLLGLQYPIHSMFIGVPKDYVGVENTPFCSE